MPKLPISPKKAFFRKFHLSDFCLLLEPYHAARFEKNYPTRVWENCSFGPKKDFWEISLNSLKEKINFKKVIF